MSFPRYERYKDSGVEWLGEVPEHWKPVPLKRLATFINGDAFKPSEWAGSGTPIIRIQNLNGSDEFNYYEGEVEPRYLVHDGDLLFGWSGNRGTSFGPFLWKHDEVCALNQHIFRVVPESIEKRSLYWILKAVTAHVEDQAHGIIGMVHVTKGELGSINVPVPPQDEGRSITTFLESETGKIDGLIEEQRRLIDLLKEKRQAVISHAVTKGLNHDAPMKDSGLSEIGQMPATWTCKPLKRISSVVVGIVVDPSTYTVDEGLPFIFGGDIREGTVDWINSRRISDQDSRLNKKTRLVEGDLLTVRVGAPGVTTVVPRECEGGNCASVMLTRRGDFDSDWLCFAFNSPLLQAQFDVVKYGATQQQFNISHAVDFIFPVPPRHEQSEIASILKCRTSAIDELATECEYAISLLQERRSALISAAVTGKIDVRNYVPSEAAELEEAYEPA